MNSDQSGDAKDPNKLPALRSLQGPDLSKISSDIELQLTIESPIDTPEQSSLSSKDATMLVPGHRLGRFRILQYIGGGGMGQVYRAADPRLDRDVAIKILPGAFVRDPDLLSRFQAEARAASALNHPNVVAIYDIGREDDLCWIVSELIIGHSLRWVLEAGKLTPRRVMEIGSQIAEGLAAAHAAGFIHRDLKPENIMLTREDRVKILDFGLAKSAVRTAGLSAGATATQVGVILGTPGYMSPEQIAGGPIDPRSDIFSLGVILYEMLAEKRPFTGIDRMSVWHATLTENPPALPPAVPPDLIRITERCLEKKPERRLQSAADVAFALQMAAGAGTLTPLPLPSRQIRRVSRVMLTAGAYAIAAAALIWLGLKLRPVESPLQGTLRQLTWDEALTTDGTISSDGRFVAYASDRADGRNLNIFVQQTDGTGTLQLTNDSEANDEPTFSPDGSRIAFESRHATGGIREVAALGGEISLIVAGGRHPRYSPNGRFILYAKVGSEASLFGGWGAELFVQPILGGTPILITRGCAHVVAEAVWSPDSQNVLASATCDGTLGLWLLSADGKTRQLTNGADLWNKLRLNSTQGLTLQSLDQWLTDPPRILLPVTDGDIEYEMAVPISSQGSRFLEPVRRINFGPGITFHAAASENGRIVLTSIEHSSNLWELPIDITGHMSGKPRQITRSKGILIHPALSRDGRNVAFVLAHSARDELQVLNLESHAPVVTLQTGWIQHPVFSQDGGKIDYEAETRALEIGTGGGPAMEIFPQAGGYLSDWSADGRQFLWLGRAQNQTAVSIVDRATLKTTQILKAPDGDLYQPHFSPDEKYVTFNALRNQHSRIYAAPLGSNPIHFGDWIPLTDGTTWDDKPRLSIDAKLLFFVSDRDGFPCIWVQRLTANMHPTGEPEAVYHSHLLRRSLSGAGLGDLELNVFRNKLIFTQRETLGNVWLLDPPTNVKQ
jgi:eukaryotic-like serine/threonine-protein kinase